jgi:hypothetical protein
VLAEVAIDESYPRDDAFRHSPAFAAHARQLSACVAAAGADADDAPVHGGRRGDDTRSGGRTAHPSGPRAR